MPSAETQAAVAVEVQIDASPETVFDFFTDPDKMIQWMGRTAELDPRPRGASGSTSTVATSLGGSTCSSTRPTASSSPGAGSPRTAASGRGSSTVEVTLIPEGEGTRVRLVTPRAYRARIRRRRHRHGWDHYMPRLAIVAAGGDAGADPWATPEGTEQD